jgi:hypothetical protein
MALGNHTYDKIKILHELSCILWFIKKHALKNAKNDKQCLSLLKKIEADLTKHINALHQMICE